MMRFVPPSGFSIFSVALHKEQLIPIRPSLLPLSFFFPEFILASCSQSKFKGHQRQMTLAHLTRILITFHLP